MKHILSILFLSLLGTTLFAQASRVQVINRTDCTVWYSFIGGPGAPTCAPPYTGSGIIALAGGGSAVYPPTLVPGWGAPPYRFVGARIYAGPTACPTPIGQVWEPCAGAPLTFGYPAMTANCSFCRQITAVWTPASAPGGVATLTFM